MCSPLCNCKPIFSVSMFNMPLCLQFLISSVDFFFFVMLFYFRHHGSQYFSWRFSCINLSSTTSLHHYPIAPPGPQPALANFLLKTSSSLYKNYLPHIVIHHIAALKCHAWCSNKAIKKKPCLILCIWLAYPLLIFQFKGSLLQEASKLLQVLILLYLCSLNMCTNS